MKYEGFKIVLNGKTIGSTLSATKADCKKWVKDNILFTHMGEWRKIQGGYEYSTTVGRYYQFIKY
jgi:hypothetical protein